MAFGLPGEARAGAARVDAGRVTLAALAVRRGDEDLRLNATVEGGRGAVATPQLPAALTRPPL